MACKPFGLAAHDRFSVGIDVDRVPPTDAVQIEQTALNLGRRLHRRCGAGSRVRASVHRRGAALPAPSAIGVAGIGTSNRFVVTTGRHLASGSAWTYGLVFALAALDVLAPIVPSESLLVAAAALSASGRLDVFLVAAAAATGALLGDNVAFLCRRLLDSRVRRCLEATRRRRERLEWAGHQLDRRGGTIIVGARFIPGGAR